MSRYFTHYWKNSTWYHHQELDDGSDFLNHTAGNLFTRLGVDVGDTVYVVTVLGGNLYLAGKMIVGTISDAYQAAKILGCQVEDLWEASEHIVASEATPISYELTLPLDVTGGLRFVSVKGSRPLEFVTPGQLDVQTLRGVRQLDPSSALELDALLPPMQKVNTGRKIRNQKPQTCSNCGSKRIATIQYGMPAFSDELQRDIEVGKVVLGGCVIGDDDPPWQCVDCGTSISKRTA